ncbi:MAG TPA: nuclear transport factor 2 family protein [Allosphingosinicella sp.]|nr:nuclear transport factor 2 family protein [Allosphingosinicella sp.]
MAVHKNPNVAALERAYAHWSETKGGSAAEVLALFDERVEMRSVLTPELPSEIAGPHLSRDRAADYFAALAREWEMLYFDVYQFIADGAEGPDVVMVGRCAWRHRESGAEVDTPKVDLWHFENGRATRFTELFDSLAFARALGAA